MCYFDISKIETLFKRSIFWNINNWALVSYHRKDYHGDVNLNLDQAVENNPDYNPEGPIRLLTHLRYFSTVLTRKFLLLF